MDIKGITQLLKNPRVYIPLAAALGLEVGDLEAAVDIASAAIAQIAGLFGWAELKPAAKIGAIGWIFFSLAQQVRPEPKPPAPTPTEPAVQ